MLVALSRPFAKWSTAEPDRCRRSLARPKQAIDQAIQWLAAVCPRPHAELSKGPETVAAAARLDFPPQSSTARDAIVDNCGRPARTRTGDLYLIRVAL